MTSRKNKHIPRQKTFAVLTKEEHTSDAFQDLPSHIQMLYVSMKQATYGVRKPYNTVNRQQPPYNRVQEDDIYFSRKDAQQYCKRYKSNPSLLYSDIRVLVEHGFIEIVYSGKNTKERSVYRFSYKWKVWKKQD